jgi:trigger factor
MSYSVEITDINSVEKNFKINIQRDIYDGKFEKSLVTASSKAHLKGYRPGKAPRAVVKKFYGDRIELDLISDFVREAVVNTSKEKDMPLIDIAPFTIEKNEASSPLEVSVKVSLYPKPEVSVPSDFVCEYEVLKLGDDEINAYVENIRQMFAVEEEAGEGDVVSENSKVTIAYTASVDGEADEKMASDNQESTLGSKELPEEIEKALIGMKVGDSKEVEYTFPETSTEELKGKAYTFNITLKGLKKRILPELGDDFASKTGLGANMSELKEWVRKKLKRQNSEKNRNARDTAMVAELVKANQFDVPQVLVDGAIREMLVEFRVLNPKDKNFNDAPVDQYRSILGEKGQDRVRQMVIIETLTKDLGFADQTEESVEAFLSSLVEEYEADREELNQEFGFPKEMKFLKRMTGVALLMDELAKKATLKEKEVAKPE